MGQVSAIQFFYKLPKTPYLNIIQYLAPTTWTHGFDTHFSVVIPAKASSSQASLKETMLGWSTLHSLGGLELSASTNHGQLQCWGRDDCNCFSTSPDSEPTKHIPRYAFRQIFSLNNAGNQLAKILRIQEFRGVHLCKCPYFVRPHSIHRIKKVQVDLIFAYNYNYCIWSSNLDMSIKDGVVLQLACGMTSAPALPGWISLGIPDLGIVLDHPSRSFPPQNLL